MFILFNTEEDIDTFITVLTDIRQYIRTPISDAMLEKKSVAAYWYCELPQNINPRSFTHRSVRSDDPGTYYDKFLENVIRKNIEFWNSLLYKFSAENVLLGIDSAEGGVVGVSSYLANISALGMVGSLNEVVRILDLMLLAGVPPELAPFVTTARLEEFRWKIQNYISNNHTPIL